MGAIPATSGCQPAHRGRDLDLPWEAALVDLPVERRAAEAGLLKHGGQPKYSLRALLDMLRFQKNSGEFSAAFDSRDERLAQGQGGSGRGSAKL